MDSRRWKHAAAVAALVVFCILLIPLLRSPRATSLFSTHWRVVSQLTRVSPLPHEGGGLAVGNGSDGGMRCEARLMAQQWKELRLRYGALYCKTYGIGERAMATVLRGSRKLRPLLFPA